MEIRLEDLKAQSAALGSLLESSQYADLLIRCKDGTSIRAHKSVVCSQSKFFENACKPGRFKEGQENSVKLDFGDSTTIKHMLKYLYTAFYPANSATMPQFHFHAQMYVLADFYDIASLRSRAESMFEANAAFLPRDPCRTAFFAMIRYLYSNDSANEERLRQIITRCANRAMPLLLKPNQNKKVEILEVIEEQPKFARDLIVASSALMENVKSVDWRLKCTNCGWIWATAESEDPPYYDSDDERYLTCPSCHLHGSWEDWKRCKIEGEWCQ